MKISILILQLIFVSFNAFSINSLEAISIHSEGFVQTCKNFRPASSQFHVQDGLVRIPASLSYTKENLTLRIKTSTAKCTRNVTKASVPFEEMTSIPPPLNVNANTSITNATTSDLSSNSSAPPMNNQTDLSPELISSNVGNASEFDNSTGSIMMSPSNTSNSTFLDEATVSSIPDELQMTNNFSTSNSSTKVSPVIVQPRKMNVSAANSSTINTRETKLISTKNEISAGPSSGMSPPVPYEDPDHPLSVANLNKLNEKYRNYSKAVVIANLTTKFYPNGYIQFNNEYFRPEDYCVSNISETHVDIEVCNTDCSDKNTLCLPKCCGIGETLAYWTFTCVPMQKDENEIIWKPFIYDTNPKYRLSAKEEKNLNIHYSRSSYKGCSNLKTPGDHTKSFSRHPYTDILRPKKPRSPTTPPDYGIPFRILKNGEIKFRTEKRGWNPAPIEPHTYCVDGLLNWGYGGNGKHLGREHDQVILSCENLYTKNNHEGLSYGHSLYYIYAGVLLTSSVFFLLTAIVHIVLYERQNIHGLAILSQSVCLLFMYVFQGLSYLVTPYLGNQNSLVCKIIAVLAHFFYLSTFSWLTVVNYDLWLTFRSMRPVSKLSKKMRRFRLYSLIGWGVPIVLMIVFLSLEFTYTDTMDDVIVPDYGKKSCYVASHARSYYMCSILAVIIPVNLLMILMTFKIFYDFRTGNGPWTTKAAKLGRYSFRLFSKLFVVMGAIWIIELIICWFYQGEEPPWFIVILNMAMPLQAVAFFLIFCCNRRTMNQLEEKYPSLEIIFGPVRRAFHISKSFDETQTNETSPNTPHGHRKGSGISLSLSGTNDRKFSTESIVSKYESVELQSSISSTRI